MKIIYNSDVYENYTENEMIEFLKDNGMAITKENIEEEYLFCSQLG